MLGMVVVVDEVEVMVRPRCGWPMLEPPTEDFCRRGRGSGGMEEVGVAAEGLLLLVLPAGAISQSDCPGFT